MKLRIRESGFNEYDPFINTVNQNVIAELNKIKKYIPSLEFDFQVLGDGYIEAKAINTDTMDSTAYVIDLYKNQLHVACDSISNVKIFDDLDSFREWVKDDIEDMLF